MSSESAARLRLTALRSRHAIHPALRLGSLRSCWSSTLMLGLSESQTGVLLTLTLRRHRRLPLPHHSRRSDRAPPHIDRVRF